MRVTRTIMAAVAAAGSFAVAGVHPEKASSDDSCTDIIFIDVHGSGAAADEFSRPGDALGGAVRERFSDKSFSTIPTPFEAAGGWPTMVKAGLKLPAGYHKSVLRMKNWLRSTLNSLENDCSFSDVVVSGYSQGAQAAGDVYQEKAWPQVVGLVLFGDPYYNHHDSSDRFGLNVRPIFRHFSKDGVLALPRPRRPFNSRKVVSFCHRGDPVCQILDVDWSQHKDYENYNEADVAVKALFGH